MIVDYIDTHRDQIVEGRKLGVETPDPRTWSSHAGLEALGGRSKGGRLVVELAGA